ncbi:MAG: tyrosine-type recombinase/integrase [Ignavibacteriae bacterium]|nr:tyrosine-type recombinase/integrase [Ignavibacteriota bacterium]
MQIKFYLDTNKSKVKERNIRCFIRDKGKPLLDETGKHQTSKLGNRLYKVEGIYLNTEEKCLPEYWDKKKQRVNLKKIKNLDLKRELEDLNDYLNSFESKIKLLVREIKRENPLASFDVIINEINKHFHKVDQSFFSAYNEFLKLKSQKVSKDSIIKFKRVSTLLREYEKMYNVNLSFDKITPLFFEKFFVFLTQDKEEPKMLNNSAYKIIQFFKTFMIWANEKANIIDNNSYKTFKSKNEENEVVYLTYDELMSLYNLKIDDEKLSRVRDLFLFQCFTGVRYSDIENLQRVDIQGPTWKLRTQKTRDIIEIPLNNYALGILAKYKEWEKPLPIISNQKVNLYLKEVCELAKINAPVKIVKFRGIERIEETFPKFEVISSHTARRTFISLSLERGMKPDVIMSITGHKTYRMMQRYLKIADKHKRDEMEKAWGSSLRIIHQ